MPRSLSAGIAAHLLEEHHSRALMLRIDVPTGDVFGITEHDLPIPYDMGDGMGTIMYESEPSIFPSQLELSLGFDVDDVAFKGNVTDVISRARLFNGYFADAEARLFMINWANPSDGFIPLFKGFATEIETEDDEFTWGFSSEIAKFQLTRGRIVTPYCDAQFGDERCTKEVTPVSATVTAVSGLRNFTVSFAGTYANDYFNKGTIAFTSGELAGGRRLEIVDWSSGGSVELWNRMPTLPTVGDTLELRQGCGKTIGDCVFHENGINFRGFPFVPGKDRFLRFAVPGSGGTSGGVGSQFQISDGGGGGGLGPSI